MEPPRDSKKSWGIYEEADGFYYYSAEGNPYGPYKDEDLAMDGLDLYERAYEAYDEEIIDPDKNE